LGIFEETWAWAAALLGALALAQAAAAALLRAPGLSAGAIAAGASGCCAWLLAGDAAPEMPQAADWILASILGGALFATSEIFRLSPGTAPRPGGETERSAVAYTGMLAAAALVVLTAGSDVVPPHQAVTLLAFAAAFSAYACASG